MNGELPVRVTRRAAREISEASEWWEANRPESSGAFREEIERAFDLIATYPGVGARTSNEKLADIRRVYLGDIRHHLYYRTTSEAVEVLALWHASRGTGPDV